MRRALWPSLLLMVGCTRGCPSRCGGGEPAVECGSDKDCKTTERCYAGYCQSPEGIAVSESCKGTPECKERGACFAGLTRSFLGANSHHTCLVERAEDCAASKLCAEQGKCGLARTPGAMSDGYCAATDPKQCVRSERCRTHDECTRDGDDCVRSWSDCTGEPMSSFDAKADLGGTWKPADQEEWLLACVLEDKYKQTTSWVRAANRCQRGPELGSTTRFLFRTRIDTSGSIEVAIQADAKRGTYRNGAYLKIAYAGESPFSTGSSELPTLICHVVPEASAKKNAAAAIARAEAAMAKLDRRVELDRARPRGTDDVRTALREAESWVGTNDPAVVKARASFEAVIADWHRALDAAIVKLVPDDTGPKGSKARVLGTVCGDALRARIKGDFTKDQCAVELAIQTRDELYLSRAAGDVTFRFLRPGADATVIDGSMLEAHTTKDPKPDEYKTIPAGEEAIVLVVPKPMSPLAPGMVITGSDFLARERFALKLDR